MNSKQLDIFRTLLFIGGLIIVGVAFAIAAILMILTVLINLVANLVQKYFEKRRSL